jgi:hypothetical protein
MVYGSLHDSWCPATPATIQWINYNGQSQAALPPDEGRRAPVTGMAKKPDSVGTLSNRTVERLRSQAQIVPNTLSPLRVLDVLLRTSVEKG